MGRIQAMQLIYQKQYKVRKMLTMILEALENRVKGVMAIAIGYQLTFISWWVIPHCWFLASMINAVFWSLIWATFLSKNQKSDKQPYWLAKVVAGFGLFGGAVTGISTILYIMLSLGLTPSVGIGG